jgi:hypothetical protein
MLGNTNPGIYAGGYLKKVSNTVVTLSPMTLEIGDGTVQVSIQTSTPASITNLTLDGGTLAAVTPILVLRWAYATSAGNYCGIYAVTKSGIQANDVVIGEVEFSGLTITGFDYTDRTPIDTLDSFLKVEETQDTELYVMLRGGRIQSSSDGILIASQKIGPFSLPNSPNSRIDLVYITEAGVPAILQGNQSVSPVPPNYGNKLVLAEVLITNGASNIAAANITDARSFISPKLSADGTSIKDNGSGIIGLGAVFGARTTKSLNTAYLAATDGIATAILTAVDKAYLQGLVGPANPPSTLVVRAHDTYLYSSPNTLYNGLVLPVRKGEYWKITTTGSGGTPTGTVFWLPIGS